MKHKNLPGFTLIELIVVLSIVVMMSSVVIFNYNGTRAATAVLTTTYDVAGIFRSAETGGRGAAQLSYQIATNDLNPAVGVYMELSFTDNSVQKFILYKSKLQGTGYTAGVDLVLDAFTFRSPDVMVYVCTSPIDYSAKTCNHSGFLNSWIEFNRLSSKPTIDPAYDAALISPDLPTFLVQSTKDPKQSKFIIIERTGNIYIR